MKFSGNFLDVRMSRQNKHIYVFGPFHFDPRERLLLRDNRPIPLTPKVADTLEVLLQNAGQLVDKDQLMRRVWPDSVVEEGNLNKNIFVLRKVLGRFDGNREYIETIPKRGYRFVAALGGESAEIVQVVSAAQVPVRLGLHPLVLLGAFCVLLALATLAAYKTWFRSRQHTQRTLTRVTFDDGLQIGATWSPDGRYIAYSSSQGGKFDIWIQQISGGDPVQITKGPGNHWQPDWSPDGKYIAYRSEGDSGGLYVIPALGGLGLERKISTFGYYPRWSPDSRRILFQPTFFPSFKSLYVVDIDGNPTEVLTVFFKQHERLVGRSAAWFPDGKRISICAEEPSSRFAIWTLPLSGGPGVQSKIDSALFYQPEQSNFGFTSAVDFKFSWASSGDAIYLERNFGSADNLWKLTVKPTSMQITSVTRLTTGVGPDTMSSVSPDGTKLAFTAETRHIQVWAAPFDSALGKLTGSGESITPPSVEAWSFSLSRDGDNLAYSGRRGSVWGMWEKSLVTGREFPIGPNDIYRRVYPIWGNDGGRIAYHRWMPPNGGSDLALWSRSDRKEQVITNEDVNLYDWSPNGSAFLVSLWNGETSRAEVWSWPVAAKSVSTGDPKRIAADRDYYLFQPQYSPDARWIAFEAVRDGPDGRKSTIFVIPSAGGSWIPVTDGVQWDDKPRWSPYGHTIYYVSGHDGIINVWGRRFDAKKQKMVGDPFRVTDFSGMQLMQYDFISNIGLSIVPGKLAVTALQGSGSIWVLENVDR